MAHARPPATDIERFGFANSRAYLDFIRERLPAHITLTYSKRLFDAVEEPKRGGRRDDAQRVRDTQDALNDPATVAIVGCSGGAWMTRILPHLDFSPLDDRRSPLWLVGFSEMTNLVNLVAARRYGRGLYWLCPNYLAWKIKPRAKAREAFAAFWRDLPAVLRLRDANGRRGGRPLYLDARAEAGMPIVGRLRLGNATSGTIRVIGGCMSVLVAMLTGPLSRGVRPEGKWLAIEDVSE